LGASRGLSRSHTARSLHAIAGTLVQVSKATHPFLWKAFQVSVGRLGVITAVTVCKRAVRLPLTCVSAESCASALQFKLVPNGMMIREKVDVTVDAFLEEMKRVQEGYNREGDASPAGTTLQLCA
jgi:hypothetical protein